MAEMPELTVSVEQAIHKGVREAFQMFLREFGVRVLSVDVDWIDATTLQDPNAAIIREVTMVTSSRGEPE